MIRRIALVLLAGGWAVWAAEPAVPVARPRLDILLRLKGTDLSANPAVRTALERALVAWKGEPEFLELVRAFDLKDQSAGLVALASAHPDDSVGAESLQRVLADGGIDLIRQALAGADAVAIARALGNVTDESALGLLTPIVAETPKSLELRQAAVRSLARTEAGANALLELARAKRIPGDLKSIAASQLAAVPWGEIQAAAAGLLPVAAPAAGPAPAFEAILALRGDAARGQKLFEGAASCATCHTANGKGVDFGPGLSEIGDKFDKQAMYSAIVDPSSGIAFGYELWAITLRTGAAFGLITSETEDEIAIKAPGNIVTRYRKSDVTEKKAMPASAMPAGLLQPLDAQETADLLEYLSTLKKSR